MDMGYASVGRKHNDGFMPSTGAPRSPAIYTTLV